MPRLLLILGSGLSVSAILGIVIYLLIRERGSAELVAIRAATNIVQLIDADVLRNAELYDKSLLDLRTSSTSRHRFVIWPCSTVPRQLRTRAISCCSTKMAR